MKFSEFLKDVTAEDYRATFEKLFHVDIGINLAGLLLRLIDLRAPIIMDEVKRAWLAGLFEGEGSVFVTEKSTPTGCAYPVFAMQVNMTDEDIVRRACEYAGVGLVSGPHKTEIAHHKPFWIWKVNKRDHVYFLCKFLRPFMGVRRGERMDQVIEASESTGRKRWRHGSRAGYEVHKCKCDVCRASNTIRLRKYRQSRAALLDQLHSANPTQEPAK